MLATKLEGFVILRRMRFQRCAQISAKMNNKEAIGRRVAVGGALVTAFLGVFGNTAEALVAVSVPNLVMT